jgi:branched-chain amino acid transport system ATP-binding protein
MSKPSFLLLDEPTIGLAPIIVTRIGEILATLKTEAEIGVLLVEQNVGFALKVADTVLVMSQGRDVYIGSPSALSDRDYLSRLFFGVRGAATGSAQ